MSFAERILAATKATEEILTAVDWLTVYTVQSADMADQFVSPQFATKILAPLVKAIPFVPVSGPFYWVSESSKLNPRRVASFTTLSSKRDWKLLAESIGAHFEPYVYEVTHFKQLSNYKWVTNIAKYLKANADPQDNRVQQFQSVVDYRWQKELICIIDSGTRTKQVYRIP